MEIYKSLDGSELAVRASTWELNPRISFQSLSGEFRSNPVKAWRNYGSVVGGGADNLAIKDPQEVVRHLSVNRVDPWNAAHDRFFEWFRGKPNRKYFIHFDLAKGTAKDVAGVALVHREPNGVVVLDWLHGHKASPGKDIQFAELRQYVFDLTARGFKIEMVTYDQWQSIETRQILESRNFKTDEVSADKTMMPYDTLIEMMLTDRLDYYNHPQFVREMQQLRTSGLKYDHPKNGTKDVADAAACAVWKCIDDALENPVAASGVLLVKHSPARRPSSRRRYETSVW